MVAVELSGHSIGSLRRFPTDVSSVVLEETALTDLSVLASSTRTLVLERNDDLLLDPLPGLMVSLKLDGGTGLSSTVDAELERLHLSGTWLGNAAYLPRSLVTLDLRTRANLRQVAARCPRLRQLTAHGLRVPGVAKIDDLPQLTSLKVVEPPKRIETDRPLTTLKLHQVTVPRVQLALDLSQITSFAVTLTDLDSVELLGANGESLSVDQLLAAMPKLTELSLRNSSGKRVPALPPTLRSLDLRGTRFDGWPDRLPPALEELRLAGADVQQVPLQDSLTVLDISATGIELESLPSLPHLRELTVHPDQVQALGRLPALTSLHVVPASDL
jgi:hypothetical protein